MSSFLSVSIRGLRKLIKTSTNILNALDNDSLVAESSNLLLSRVKQRFAREEDPDGVKWKRSNSAIRRGGRTLYDTGRLYNSLDIGGRGNSTFAISTDVPYARDVQEGPPERMFMGFGDEDITEVNKLLAKRIQRVL